jgi:cullin 1
LTQLSKGELRTLYLSQTFTLQVSTYQLGILIPYNHQTVYTFEELGTITGMSQDSLKGNLGLLLKSKLLLLENEKYALNLDFKSKKLRINLNITIKSEQKQETDQTLKTIEKDRELIIQAAIVRIMKSRKVLKHVQLMQEVISQLQNRFQPQVSSIKKCIDILLEKEYMERTTDQKDLYSYVA